MTVAFAAPAVPDLLGTSPADLAQLDASAPVATLDEARGRAERIRAGLESYTQMRQDIADAYARRDWAALDYPTWFAYLEGEYGAELKRLTRDERRQAVTDLREQGLSKRAIAAAVGADEKTVRNDLSGAENSAPDSVTGADGKTYPASRPPFPGPSDAAVRPPVDPGATPEPVAASTAPSGSGPVEAVASPREGGDATVAPDRSAATVAAVQAALDKFVPDPGKPKRDWQKELYLRLEPVSNFTLWLKVEDAAQFADEHDVETLRLLAASFADIHRRVVAAQTATVTPLRRIK